MRSFYVYEDRRELGAGFGVEQVELFPDELTDKQILLLSAEDRAYVCAIRGLVQEGNEFFSVSEFSASELAARGIMVETAVAA
jgi:hypothetical protein